jgi:hypothetical protein
MATVDLRARYNSIALSNTVRHADRHDQLDDCPGRAAGHRLHQVHLIIKGIGINGSGNV